jgi:uncharacterized protein
MTTTAVSDDLTPVQPSERIPIIDSLRGFALLGILLVNMGIFIHPIFAFLLPPDPATPLIDRAAAWFIHFAAEGKFYALFSLLFGLGFAIQFIRAEERARRIVPLYLRRLFVLLLIGMAHAFLVWTGDILILYAVLGFVLILFRKARPKTLLVWIGLTLGGYLLLLGGIVGLLQLARLEPTMAVELDQNFAAQEAYFLVETERAYQVYGQGSFVEITQHRVNEYLSFVGFAAFGMVPGVFAMFLAGLYFGRRRLFYAVEENITFFRKLAWWGLAIGLPANLLYATIMSSSASRLELSPAFLAATVAQIVGGPALSLFYLSALTLLSRRQTWHNRLQHLAPAGRMALTNYLMQSIICTLIFYGYGFGLFGRVGAAVGMLLTLVIFAAQVAWSRWWLQRYRYGPAEWLWRSLTYLHWQPLRR